MFWYLLLAAIIGGSVSFGITFLVCRLLPQERIRKLNEEQIQLEEEILSGLRERQDKVLADIEYLKKEKQTISNHVIEIKQQAEETAKVFYDKEMMLAQERLDRALERVSAQYQADEEACKQEYLSAIKEFAEDFAIYIKEQKSQFLLAQEELTQLQNTVHNAVEAAKREEEKRTEKDFYRLVLSETDLQEIGYLRQVEPFLRDKEALNKVIWKVYYEKPYTDLIGRVVGNSVKTGIYKITNINNQMCYIGQAVDVASRFKQHLKRAVGAEAPTRNKLYPAMSSIGAHNFTFEIVEECDRAKLNEREDYWQDYFKAKEFGYSIK